MLYNLSGEYPFFLTAFLQIVTFAGIYFKLGDLMGMFSLQSGDSQSMGSRIMRRPRMLMHAHMHRLQHKFCKAFRLKYKRLSQEERSLLKKLFKKSPLIKQSGMNFRCRPWK